MKKNVRLLISFAVVTSFGFSQNIPNTITLLSAQGGFDITETISLEWSLGENFVETTVLEDNIITQGFHQSYINKDTYLNAKSIANNFFKSVLYPNPVSDQLHVQLNRSEDSKLNLSLYEITGRFIKNTFLNTRDSNIKINVSDLSSGVYILQISNLDGFLLETYKVIKH